MQSSETRPSPFSKKRRMVHPYLLSRLHREQSLPERRELLAGWIAVGLQKTQANDAGRNTQSSRYHWVRPAGESNPSWALSPGRGLSVSPACRQQIKNHKGLQRSHQPFSQILGSLSVTRHIPIQNRIIQGGLEGVSGVGQPLSQARRNLEPNWGYLYWIKGDCISRQVFHAGSLQGTQG